MRNLRDEISRDIPFRNGFSSFLTALTFGLTLGGGGEDSAACEFTITEVKNSVNDEFPYDTRYVVDGMDVGFDILAIDKGEPATKGQMHSIVITYYIGNRNIWTDPI